ncbi:MAG TPA: TetR/AcrR family transcriptional regulator [Rhodoglobus sp.]|nr:TetR/AcrR family transcriptional regulator [Rhodoglobus sp.]
MSINADFVTPTIPTRTEPVQQRSAERIANLLDAAAQLIDDQGIDGLTTSDVAARSGSSVGVVYRYFPNIQELLRALAQRNMQRYTDRVFAIMAESPAEWMGALDGVIDTYVDMVRIEPGFRALGFGDVITKRFLRPDTSNNTVLAKAFADLLVQKYELAPSPELVFDLEVVVEIADALLKRAFQYDKQGDDRFIDKLRTIVVEYLAPHAGKLPNR